MNSEQEEFFDKLEIELDEQRDALASQLTSLLKEEFSQKLDEQRDQLKHISEQFRLLLSCLALASVFVLLGHYFGPEGPWHLHAAAGVSLAYFGRAIDGWFSRAI